MSFNSAGTPLLQIQNLSRVFAKQQVVRDLNFRVHRSEVLGLLGANGAGKSTTLRMLSGVLYPSAGEIQVCGYAMSTSPLYAKRKLGYLPESNPLYTDYYVFEYVYRMARMHQLSDKEARDSTQTCLERCGLLEVQHRKLKTLSKGYRQRVGIARALVHDPAVLILDEPFAGLDADQLQELSKLIQAMRRHKAVVLSTHRLPQVSLLCDTVLVLRQGRTVFQGATAQWRAQMTSQEV